MKRLIPLLLLITAAVLAGCALPGGIGAPAPTYTQAPTYTPLPTYTPPPTATATFLPTATSIPSSTPTSELTATTGATATIASSTTTGVLLYGANLREGPGTDYRSLDLLSAGDVLTINGRDNSGQWLCVATAIGQNGWVALQQFQGPIDVARIPLCSVIPTPNATQLARGTNTPRPTGTAGTGTPRPTGTPGTGTPTANPSTGNYFEVLAGGPEVCNTVTFAFDAPFPVVSKTADIVADSTLEDNQSGPFTAYQFQLPGFPNYFSITPQGAGKPGQCLANESACQSVTIKLCGKATPDAPTGGFVYEGFYVTLVIGETTWGSFEQNATANFSIKFKIPEKK